MHVFFYLFQTQDIVSRLTLSRIIHHEASLWMHLHIHIFQNYKFFEQGITQELGASAC